MKLNFPFIIIQFLPLDINKYFLNLINYYLIALKFTPFKHSIIID